jgi:hypothetical protein
VQGAVASVFTVGDEADPTTLATVIWAEDEPLADDHDNEVKE